MSDFADIHEQIEIIGAREHNLKNLHVTIPRNKLVVVTGLSGSGKSSLAFDTLFAEGQRRYMESFSIYARQFIGNMERPDVDKITGLSPVISIEQKTTNKNPRSTVGTVTEIYDFLRLLFAKASDAYSYNTGEKMIKYTDEQILNLIIEKFIRRKITILAPLVKGRKGHYRELFEQIRRLGLTKVRVDGEIKELSSRFQVDRYKVHDIEAVIDRIEIKEETKHRLSQSVNLALKYGKGTLMVVEEGQSPPIFFSRNLMCPTTGIAYDDPAPNLFSFNSPYGACPKCNGLGTIAEVDLKKIIPNPKISIRKGGLAPIGAYRDNWIFWQINDLLKKVGFNLDTVIEDIPKPVLNILLFGTNEIFNAKVESQYSSALYNTYFEGIISFLIRQQEELESKTLKKWIQGFTNEVVCPLCNGARLKKESLHFKIKDKNIAELGQLSIAELSSWFEDIEQNLNQKQNAIAKEILKEIRPRLQFLLDVGLDYLELNRSAQSLSGGESQRIRLATQIGSQLVGVLYILDEPSIGLHQRDNSRLIQSLKKLRDTGNSVIVVEHDKEMIESADFILDIGPRAGINGGQVVAAGTLKQILKSNSLTAQYLKGKLKIEIPANRRIGNGKYIKLYGCTGHNLQNVNLTIPLGKLICVTGVSGSGKSSLITQTLYPILSRHFYRSLQKPLPYKKIEGLENIDKVIEIDQSPIGRTPRSNPATYTDVFTEIRSLFASLPESQIRGYKPGRFSFNVKGGRCENCGGGGLRVIEMNFLPDVYVKCEVCNGRRYNRETLEVRYRGKSIGDVLELTIDKAVEFFENIPSIQNKLKTLQDVGLGYITLGQSSTTLSGGEAQRIKLAAELSKKDTGNTFYILDEPTTGLHFEDIRILLGVIDRLVNMGNTVLIIEHNLDIIKRADYIIDIGPEGGKGGGKIVAEGSPEEVSQNPNSITGFFLKKELIG